MARIRKADHPSILKAIDEERRPVASVAADYGCTPANIYALLRRLRAAVPPAPVAQVASPPAAEAPPAADLFAPPPEGQAVASADPPPPQVASARPDATVTDLPRRAPPQAQPAAGRPVGAKLAKPGYGLVMRTAEGEETTAPFRSLEDLLTAIKPILRAAARDPDPVWFSIQPLDLAAVEFDAA
jgi:hypothetical protein